MISLVSQRLRGEGLTLDLGAMRVRLHSNLRALAPAIVQAYRHFDFNADDAYADSVLALRAERDPWRPWRARVRFVADGAEPFSHAPAAIGLAQLEWGMNWVFAHLFTRHLLLHAGALEHAGVGVLLVAGSGAGKSTLTAALGLRGFRILSDEFGILRMRDRMLLPLAKPVALKNASVDLIRAWSEQAMLGPLFKDTHKGAVAHLALPKPSAVRRHEPARPGLVVFPTWRAGEAVALTRVMPARALAELGCNSFNYARLGRPAFDAACDLVSGCDCYRVTYGRLDEVVPLIAALCTERSARGAGPWRGV
jgi:HprK-related kinase A